MRLLAFVSTPPPVRSFDALSRLSPAVLRRLADPQSQVSGNFALVTKRILEKIPPGNAKMSYMYDKHIFHYIVDDSLVFMTMADEAFGRRIPFSFLEDIKSRFKALYLTES